MRYWIPILVFASMSGANLGEAVELQLTFDRPAMIEWITGESLQITWMDVLDSRCPEGVTCVWEGEVAITIGVALNGQDLGELDITLHAGDEEEAYGIVGEYFIQLIRVAPYPEDGIETNRSDYAATLDVLPLKPLSVERSKWGQIKARF